jgi:Tol biopolymer transport system component
MKATIGVVAATVIAVTALGGCKEDAQDTRPVVSPETLVKTDRPQLAFIRRPDLVLADDRGQHLEVLTGQSLRGTIIPTLFSGISWSSDGKRIAFAGMERPDTEQVGEPERTPPTDIYTIAADGSEVERITEVGDAGDPLFSPDGKTIIFTRRSFPPATGPLRGELWSVSPESSALTQLTEVDDWQADSAGSFSPDGSRLAFTRGTLDPETGEQTEVIYVMKPDGSAQEQLIDRASDPAFSPDGERIAFVSDRDENGQLSYGDRTFFASELYVANADGSDAERLTETEALNEASPSWLSDGSRIAYQRGEQTGNAEATSILEMNAAGSCSHQILGSGTGGDESPVWRPSAPREGGGPLSC